MVIAPANTGRERSNNKAVITTDQIKSGIQSNLINVDFIFKTVEIKLIDPKIEEIPAKCKLKIARSTENPEWCKELERGG